MCTLDEIRRHSLPSCALLCASALFLGLAACGGASDSDYDPAAACAADAFQDPGDSDGDGLSDSEEAQLGTDPRKEDSDGDEVSDFGERGIGTNPLDRQSTLPERDFFVVLPYKKQPQERKLKFSTNIKSADVYFLIDATASMAEEIANVRDTLTNIASAVSQDIPDVQMGVGAFRDFPFAPQGAVVLQQLYGLPSDRPYAHGLSLTDNLPEVQNFLGSVVANTGADLPEAQTEALYQVATGEGGEWSGLAVTPSLNLVPATLRLPPANCAAGLRGYACFRQGTTPIVVLVSDAPWHNGPEGARAYSGITPAPHTFDQARDALVGLGARMVSVVVDGSVDGRSDSEAMLRATGSIDAAGNPLVYDAPNGVVSPSIVSGLQALARETPQEVGTGVANGDNPEGFDATPFIVSITPNEGYDAQGRPGKGYRRKTATKFEGVSPDSTVEFKVEFQNNIRPHQTKAQIFEVRIDVLGPGGSQLDSRRVFVVVPPCSNPDFKVPGPGTLI